MLRYRAAGRAWPAARILAASRLTPEQQREVWAEMQKQETERLKPLYESFEQRISYEELRLIRLYLLCGGELH